MASMAETTELLEIGPTAQKGERYSDISMSILFSAYASAINSERQAVWQRYNTMLFANVAAQPGARTVLPDRTAWMAW